jgi:hypothetical protein
MFTPETKREFLTPSGLANWIGFNSFNRLGFSMELFRLVTYGVIHQMVWFGLDWIAHKRRNDLVVV